jgi:hypothetical protein
LFYGTFMASILKSLNRFYVFILSRQNQIVYELIKPLHIEDLNIWAEQPQMFLEAHDICQRQ